MVTQARTSGDWLIYPPPETPDLQSVSIEEWQAAVEQWCQQFEACPLDALEPIGYDNYPNRLETSA